MLPTELMSLMMWNSGKGGARERWNERTRAKNSIGGDSCSGWNLRANSQLALEYAERIRSLCRRGWSARRRGNRALPGLTPYT